MTKPARRPEGSLIAQAAQRQGLSGREVARRANLSEGRYRQIVNGYMSVGGGQYTEVEAPAVTLARIANVLEISGEELASVGRDDAALALDRQAARRTYARDVEMRAHDLRGLAEGIGSASVSTGVDENGWYLVGQAVEENHDGSMGLVEVRYWPGNDRRISAVNFYPAISGAVTGVRRSLRMDDEDIEEKVRERTGRRPAWYDEEEGDLSEGRMPEAQKITQPGGGDTDHPDDNHAGEGPPGAKVYGITSGRPIVDHLTDDDLTDAELRRLAADRQPGVPLDRDEFDREHDPE